MKRQLIIPFASVCLLFSACSMDEIPQASVDKETVFSNEKGLETYSYSFYNMLPSVDDGFRQDAMCDYGAVGNYDDFIRRGAYSPDVSTGWDWGDLRNINYFIENCTSDAIDESVRNDYIGLARFFRAYFYYEKLVRFGDVPWIDHPLGVDDELLYAPRDPRTVVVQHMLEDLDFACQHISRTSDETGSLVTKWVAYAFKSRVCLFEGTFRKYHTELGLADTANELLQQAADAAQTVMNESGYSIYTGAGEDASFRSLFISNSPVTSEVMLASVAGALYACNFFVIQPDLFNFNKSIDILVMVVFGGMGSITGSLIAAIFIGILNTVLQSFSSIRMIIYGLALVGIMIFRPGGLLGTKEFTFSALFKRRKKKGGEKE